MKGEFLSKKTIGIAESIELLDTLYGITKDEREALEAMRNPRLKFEEED